MTKYAKAMAATESEMVKPAIIIKVLEIKLPIIGKRPKMKVKIVSVLAKGKWIWNRGKTIKTKMINDNKFIINQFFSEVINKGDTVVMKNLMSDKFIDHYAASNLPKGIEGFAQFFKMISSSLKNFKTN